MITFRVHDQATPVLNDAVRRVKRPRTLFQACAKAVVQVLKSHFKARQAEGNKRGWPDRRFWYGIKNSVANATGIAEVSGSHAVVTVADPRFAHKISGGTISAKRRQFLTIPLRAEAYALGGKGSVKESAPFLFPVRTAKGLYLVKSLWARSHGMAAQRLEFWFRLVRSVTQAADPRAMPELMKIYGAVEDAARKVLPIILRKEARA